MSNNEIKKLVIVGGGSAGWMSASYLHKIFNNKVEQYQITLVESTDVDSIGVGEATIHSMRFFLASIGLSEIDVMKQTNATLKHGILFKNWHGARENDEYYHPFEQPNKYSDGIPIIRHWANLYGSQEQRARFDASVSPQVHFANNNKSPKSEQNKDFEGYFPYGYHLDAIKFARYLRDVSIERGVIRIEGHVKSIGLSNDGCISSLTLNSGQLIEGDFFIDCTGFSSILMNAMGNNKFIDYSDSLLCDRAVTCQIPHINTDYILRPYTTSTAQSSGWIWDIDLTNRCGSGYVYSSQFCSEKDAETTLKKHLDIEHEDIKLKHLKMKVGRKDKVWYKNCISIGLSASFIEPLESTGLYFIDMSLRFLSEYVFTKNTPELIINKYNSILGQLVDQTKDFIVLHYSLSEREDSPFWKKYKYEIQASSELQSNLLLWKNKVPTPSDFAGQITQFTSANYAYILYGMGFKHDSPPNNALYISNERSQKSLNIIKQQCDRVMNSIPSINQYLKMKNNRACK
jgi:tryptophan halogenase